MKKKPIVIFGTGDIAELAYYYFRTDAHVQVAAFTVDSSYIKNSIFQGLPVIPFDSVSENFPPDTHDFFVALGYKKLNALRKEKFLRAKTLGYRLATFISSRACISQETRIGENCFILEDNTIQPFVNIGNNVTLWSGNHIGHHSIINDHTFISSHAVISGGVQIGEQCFVGVNATLRDHITIGERCVIGAGALLLTDAPAEGIYAGVTASRSPVPSSRLRRV
jgi:sugar O-acyltransferase (sialic acid O-acetyltransferase NeuD family)